MISFVVLDASEYKKTCRSSRASIKHASRVSRFVPILHDGSASLEQLLRRCEQRFRPREAGRIEYRIQTRQRDHRICFLAAWRVPPSPFRNLWDSRPLLSSRANLD